VTEQQPGLLTQIKSYPTTFWVANTIELVERFSFFGVRMIAALYIVKPLEEGGLAFDNADIVTRALGDGGVLYESDPD